MSLFEKYNQGDKSPDLIDKLSYKSETKNNDSLSTELYSIILNNKEEYLYMHNTLQRAEFYFAKLALKEGDVSKMSNFINKGLTINSGLLEGHDWPADWDMIREAYNYLTYHYRNKKDTLLEISTLKEMVDNFRNNPSCLNQYAWRMTELNKNLKDALDKIDKALTLTDKNNSSYPNLLDTKAEVLFRMDLFDEAIKIIDEAISIDNEYQYYKDQRNKFKKSQSEINTETI